MEEANKPKKPWYKKPWGMMLVTVLFVFFIFLFAFVFLVINTVNAPTAINYQSEKIISADILKQVKGQGNYQMGGTNPKISIVEFADFACPSCKSSYSKIRDLKLKYKDDIEIIFRDFPIITESSTNLALAAYCAGEQGFFWIMHDKLFENQGISTKEEIFSLAAEIGVEGNSFTACYEAEKYMNKIYANYSDGVTLEVTGTPTFFVNGEKISGDVPLDTWYKIIDFILSK